MATVPTIPVNASLLSIATHLEEEYGVPRELLDRFANKIAAEAALVADAAIDELEYNWLDG